MSKMQIKQVKTDTLIPYAKNSRTHSIEQVGQIAASIREFGFNNPILVDGDRGVIAGHGRLLAAQKLGLPEVPVIELGHMSDTQKRAYIIADNKMALNAGWDDEFLRLELDDLGKLDFDLELTGFCVDELTALFDNHEEPAPKEESYSEVFNIIIECEDENKQEQIFNELDAKGYKCRVQSL